MSHNGVRLLLLLFDIRLPDTIFIVGEMSYKLNWPISARTSRRGVRGIQRAVYVVIGGCGTAVFAGQNNNNNVDDDQKKK